MRPIQDEGVSVKRSAEEEAEVQAEVAALELHPAMAKWKQTIQDFEDRCDAIAEVEEGLARPEADRVADLGKKALRAHQAAQARRITKAAAGRRRNRDAGALKVFVERRARERGLSFDDVCRKDQGSRGADSESIRDARARIALGAVDAGYSLATVGQVLGGRSRQAIDVMIRPLRDARWARDAERYRQFLG
jgi:hypothetical protein